MQQRGTDQTPNVRARHVLNHSADLETRNPRQVDRPDLVAKNNRVLGLAGVSAWDCDLARVLRLTSGDRADRRHAGPVESLVRHDQGSACSFLLVTLSRIKVNEDNCPTEHCGVHSGQAPESRKSCATELISTLNDGSSAAFSHRDSSSRV